MAWKWSLINIDYGIGYGDIIVEVKIWRDTWTQSAKSITKQWLYPDPATLTMENLAARVQLEVTDYQAKKAKVAELEPSLDVEQTLA